MKKYADFNEWYDDYKVPFWIGVGLVAPIVIGAGVLILNAKATGDNSSDDDLSSASGSQYDEEKYMYKLIYPDGETEISENVYPDEESAEYAALDDCSCYAQGAEDFYLSGDYDYCFDSCDYEVFRV